MPNDSQVCFYKRKTLRDQKYFCCLVFSYIKLQPKGMRIHNCHNVNCLKPERAPLTKTKVHTHFFQSFQYKMYTRTSLKSFKRNTEEQTNVTKHPILNCWKLDPVFCGKSILWVKLWIEIDLHWKINNFFNSSQCCL